MAIRANLADPTKIHTVKAVYRKPFLQYGAPPEQIPQNLYFKLFFSFFTLSSSIDWPVHWPPAAWTFALSRLVAQPQAPGAAVAGLQPPRRPACRPSHQPHTAWCRSHGCPPRLDRSLAEMHSALAWLPRAGLTRRGAPMEVAWLWSSYGGCSNGRAQNCPEFDPVLLKIGRNWGGSLEIGGSLTGFRQVRRRSGDGWAEISLHQPIVWFTVYRKNPPLYRLYCTYEVRVPHFAVYPQKIKGPGRFAVSGRGCFFARNSKIATVLWDLLELLLDPHTTHLAVV